MIAIRGRRLAAPRICVVVDSAEDVEVAIARPQAAGLPLDVEREETCCYAKQTNVWAADPEGLRWEVYTVLDDTDTRTEGSVSLLLRLRSGRRTMLRGLGAARARNLAQTSSPSR